MTMPKADFNRGKPHLVLSFF